MASDDLVGVNRQLQITEKNQATGPKGVSGRLNSQDVEIEGD